MKTSEMRMPSAALLLGLIIGFAGPAFGQGADFCWSETWGRDAGTIPGTCGADQEKNGLLCYPKCKAGYASDGVAGCLQTCTASGGQDDGFFCGWPSYKAAEYPVWDEQRCKNNHSTGCWLTVPVIGLWVENCKAGYRHVAGFCEKSDINCSAMGFKGDRIANSCTKNHYFRETVLPGCGSGQEYDAGLCYATCKDGADGVGPVCWAKGPPGWVQCGMGWAATQAVCDQSISQQVISVVDAAVTTTMLIGSLGASAAVSTGAKASTHVFTKAAWEGVKKIGKAGVKNVLLSTAKTTAIGAIPSVPDAVLATTNGTIEQLWQIGQLEHDSPNMTQVERDHAIAQIALNTAAWLDPTGVTGVVAAYTKPVCKDVTAMTATAAPAPAATGPTGSVVELMENRKAVESNFTQQQTRAQAAYSDASARSAKLQASYNAASGAAKTALQSDLNAAVTQQQVAKTHLDKVNAARNQFAAVAPKWDAIAPSTGTPVIGGTTLAPTATVATVSWALTDGAAHDVGVGANGSVWVIGTNPVPGGYTIWRRVNNAWVNVPGGAVRIAVDPQGNAWVVNATQNIFRYDGTNWQLTTGAARDVAVGANGTVWMIGNNPEAGGYGIYRSTDKGANWTKVPGSALRISVDPQGNAWVVNNTNNIFRYDGTNWVLLSGAATDVGIGSDGAAWVIGTDGGIYRWENNTWAKKPGGAAQIAAGPNGSVWVVNQGNQIYQATAR